MREPLDSNRVLADFRQTLPVVPHASRSQIIAVALTRSPLLQPLLDRGASHSHSDLDDGPAEPEPAAVFKF